MRILITGGHATPALAMIDYIREHYPDTKILFVGRQYTDQKNKDLSFEYTEVKKRNIPFVNLETGRLSRLFSFKIIQELVSFGMGVLRSWVIISSNRPQIFLSFGGYIALPLALVCALKGIPVYTQEQTIVPGLTTKILARFAQKIFISFPQAKNHLPVHKVVLTGTPIRPDIQTVRRTFTLESSDKPLIYITGGSLGSHSINMHINTILSQILKDFTVIHQTGNVSEYDDLAVLQKTWAGLPPILKKRYTSIPHVSSDQIGSVFTQAHIVVSRAGANTVFELMTLQKPSVLIPLPWSGGGEQQKQAVYLQELGVAEVFEQKKESTVLLQCIQTVAQNYNAYQNKFRSIPDFFRANHAQQIITQTILVP